MDRWSDFGLLGKAAFISFAGGMGGMGIAVVLAKLTDSRAVGLAALCLWFAPVAIWAVCALASVAREAWPATTGVLALVMVLGLIPASQNWAMLPFVLLACPALTVALAIMGKPAQAMLAIGRQ